MKMSLCNNSDNMIGIVKVYKQIYFTCKYNTNMVKYGLRIQESNTDETPLQYWRIAEDNMVVEVPHQHALSLRDITIYIILVERRFDK